jgi:hypothetical protein
MNGEESERRYAAIMHMLLKLSGMNRGGGDDPSVDGS